jgi:ADP-ribose pyrophosphatase
MKPWDIVERKELVDASPFLKLYRETVVLENGRLIDEYYTIDQPDYCVIFAMVNHDEILGIRHYKHGAKWVNLGLPAGYIKDGELPLSAAQRELLEKTGYLAKRWEQIPLHALPGLLTNGEVATLGAATGISLGLLKAKHYSKA